ncbi:MAG: transglycosylase domain-containing protein [Gemmatimonadota bacterium]|jgi:penicillin-binding protein 1A
MSRWGGSEGRRWGITVAASLAVALSATLVLTRWLEPDCGEGTCPSLERLAGYRADGAPLVFDRSGQLAGALSGPRRIVVPLDSISPIVRAGYVAVEDRRFREHGGVDLTGAARALLANLRSGGVEEGASTITMQLARNVFGAELLGWNRWRRKLAELRLARRIEARLSKDRILELYLNQIYLGDGVYGVETAARHYFGKPVSRVGPREAALLVGLAKNPEGYDPRDHPGRARRRIATVLGVLERRGVIDAEVARQARRDVLELAQDRRVRDWGANAYYLAAVRRELRRVIPDPDRRAGVRVYTGLDQAAQHAAVETLEEGIRSVESGAHGTFLGTPAPDTLPRAVGSSPYLQGMVVAMTPASGLVTTLVGGRSYRHSEFDRAFQAQRQPGSAFKPVVYAAALSQGLRASERVSTDPVRFAARGADDWRPADHVGGEAMTVREALVRSSNTAAVRIGQRIGPEAVARQARAMGITSEIPSYPSIFLGAAEVVPADLVAAYATLGNGGHPVRPHLITRVEDSRGGLLYLRLPPPPRQAVDPGVGFLVVDMMRDVVTRGTGWRAGRTGLPFPAAGKTGTTDDSRDLWFVGMTPALAAGVWIGFDRPREIARGVDGGEAAAPVWGRFMKAAHRDLGALDAWNPPAGVRRVRVDARTGFAVGEDCPFTRGEVRDEYFLAGSEPREWCSYQRMTDDAWWRSGAPRVRIRSGDAERAGAEAGGSPTRTP